MNIYSYKFELERKVRQFLFYVRMPKKNWKFIFHSKVNKGCFSFQN